MHKIIKSYETEEDRILNYVRTPQEPMNPDDLSGGSYVDPAAILAEARAQAEVLVEEAYAEGLRRGIAKGEQQFAESVGQASEMIGEVAQQLKDHRATYVKDIESQVVALAHLVATKILGRELATSPELVNEMVQGAVERLSMEERIRARVNPSDLDRVHATESELRERFSRITHLEIIADDSIESGGCVAESDALYVDAQLSAQLNEVINLDQQRSRYRYERYLATRIVEQDAVIHELKEVAEGSRVDMHESAKLRKMMETLAEKSQVSVDHEVKRQERLAMDETASMRAAASRASVKKG